MAGPQQRRKAKSRTRTLTPSRKTLKNKQKLNLSQFGAIKERYNTKRTVKQNLEILGLLNDPNDRLEERQEQQTISPALARVKRDADGKIIEMVEDDSPASPWPALADALSGHSRPAVVDDSHSTVAVQILQEEASRIAEPKQRFASSAEQALLRRLVASHGTNVDAMARDKRNRSQATPAQLRQSVKRCGGWAALRTSAAED